MGRPKSDISHIFGTIMHTNSYGDFIPLYETDTLYDKDGHMISRMIVVKFIDTGTIDTFRLSNVLHGEIKDYFKPNVCGVGYLGNIKPPLDTKIYNLWYDMIRRCYDELCKEYKFYGAKGVKVCDRWKCFANFYEDIKNIENFQLWYNNEDYQLDKDCLQNNTDKYDRIYSLQTCKFIPRLENLKIQYEDKAKINNFRGAHMGHVLSDGTQLYNSYGQVGNNKIFLGTYYTKEAAARRANEWFMENNKPLNKLNISMAQAHLQEHFTKNTKFKPIIIDNKVLLYKLIQKEDIFN